MKKKLTLTIVTLLSLLLCIGSGYSILKEWKLQKETSCLYQTLADTIPSSSKNSSQKQTDSLLPYFSNSKNGSINKTYKEQKQSAYRSLYKKNKDFTGWIQVSNTNINYPIMQTDKTNKNYYIDKDFNKNPNPYGTPYIDERCSIETSRNAIIIYGHHMKDGSMFADLSQYKEKDFYQSHQSIQLDYLIQGKLIEESYQIFAVLTISDIAEMTYPYYDIAKISNQTNLFKKQYTAYVSALKSASLYDTDHTPKQNCPLLLLSTCDYSGKDSRMLVCAYKKPQGK